MQFRRTTSTPIDHAPPPSRRLRLAALTAGVALGISVAAAGTAAAAPGLGSGDSGSTGSLGSGSTSGSAAGSAVCGRLPVNPLLSWGWSSLDSLGPKFAPAPRGEGIGGPGALQFSLTPNQQRQYFHPAASSLSNATGMRYTYDVQNGPAPVYQLRVRGANRTDHNASGFTTLVWQPTANGHDVTPHTWIEDQGLETGKWWSTQPIAGATGGQAQPVPLNTIKAANPGAVVTFYGVSNGRNSTASDAYVDNIGFGCNTWDFEPLPSLSSGSTGS